jgi:hypothetical protein
MYRPAVSAVPLLVLIALFGDATLKPLSAESVPFQQPVEQAGSPKPAPHPTPAPTPAPPMWNGAINGTPAALADGAEAVKQALDAVNLVGKFAGRATPLAKVSVMGLSTLGAYYAIVGQHHEEFLSRQALVNDAIDHDLRRTNAPLSRDDCLRNTELCAGIARYLSPQTKALIDESASVYDEYVRSFDSNAWTSEERSSFLSKVLPDAFKELGGQAVDSLVTGTRFEETWKSIDKWSDVLAMGGATFGDSAPKASEGDLDAASRAADRQGRQTKALNGQAAAPSVDSTFPKQFQSNRDNEDRRLGAAQGDADKELRMYERELRAGDAALTRTPNPADAPNSEAPAVGGTPDSSRPAANGKPSPADPKKVDHCSSGAFKCPNGYPWPECTHPEKYDCPPPAYAAQAAKELATKKQKKQ